MRSVRFLCLVPTMVSVAVGCASNDVATHTFVDSGPETLSSDAAPSTEARYATTVISFTPGEGGGYHRERLPSIVLGPPHGGGCCSGSLDVVSLGNGGEIVLGFDVEIVDGPGDDLIVFENPWLIGGDDPSNVWAEPAEVAVSDDGTTWTSWPCSASSYPYGSCAGWHPVYATPESGVSTRDPSPAGGDRFDLADIHVARARFVRIRDMNKKLPAKDGTAGFDLDAVAILHAR